MTTRSDGVLAMQAVTQTQEASLVGRDISSRSASQSLDSEDQAVGWFHWPELTGIEFAKIAFCMVFVLTAYSLLTAGKRGRGWIVVGVIAGTLTIIAKGFLSMFVEVTREYCPPDWDED